MAGALGPPRCTKVEALTSAPRSLRTFGIGDGQWLEQVRRVKRGNDFAHRLRARWTTRQRWRGDQAAQSESPPASYAPVRRVRIRSAA